uniref:Uncharacterized protein n=1 Tax=Rhizophora mucronata TaxID=61149 RepID=A0A2P2R082_RHIMU
MHGQQQAFVDLRNDLENLPYRAYLDYWFFGWNACLLVSQSTHYILCTAIGILFSTTTILKKVIFYI